MSSKNYLSCKWSMLVSLYVIILKGFFNVESASIDYCRQLDLREGSLSSPCNVCKHCPVLMSQILTVESAFPDTSILSLSSIPLVRDWWPVSV